MTTRTRKKACESKRRYDTRREAQAHIQRLIKQGAAPRLMNAYRCPHCKGWHVGHRERGR
jgi:hypothetical protein